jgi:hypothetical protein
LLSGALINDSVAAEFVYADILMGSTNLPWSAGKIAA